MKRRTPSDEGEIDLVSLVRQARPIAAVIFTTIGGLTEHDGDLFEALNTFTQNSTGDDAPIEIGDDEFPRVIALALHAYAVGIAFGLLLRPDVFAKGGAR
jgi:hypothetical protein